MGGCAASYLRMLGAMEFVMIMKSLAEGPPKVTIVDRDNLDHKV